MLVCDSHYEHNADSHTFIDRPLKYKTEDNMSFKEREYDKGTNQRRVSV